MPSDNRGEALTLLKEVEDAIFEATGSALLAGEKCNPSDKTVIYKSLCAAGNKVAYVREDLLAPTQPTQALDSELLTAIKNAPTHSYSLAPSARSSTRMITTHIAPPPIWDGLITFAADCCIDGKLIKAGTVLKAGAPFTREIQ